MHPLAIVVIGVAIVITGILVFRLHAFLALILAALTCALLTPQEAIERFLVQQSSIEVIDAGDGLRLALGPKDGALVGERFQVVRAGEDGSIQTVAQLEIEKYIARPNSNLQSQVVFTPEKTVDFDKQTWVIRGRDLAQAKKASKKTIGERVATTFGGYCGKIGILIALAAIIGKCLLDSGAADRIVRSALNVVGERGAPVAFVCSGFLLGIPVFFDTVFYLMIPLGKSLRIRTGRNYLLYILTIVAGGTMAHSLVPPTPGPLAVAEELNIDLGTMIIAGCLVGLCSSTAALFYALLINRYFEVPLRESPDFSLADIEKMANRPTSELPSLLVSLLPILLPVVMIAGFTFLVNFQFVSKSSAMYPFLATIGNKNIALGVGAVIAMITLVVVKRSTFKELATSVQAALASGGVIILITAAGGAFGATMKEAGIASLISELGDYSTPIILTLAFLVTTAIRTAQGSATVAMLTAVGILAAFADPARLGCHPVYLALAIGCGSKPIAWMADSGFWVICKMSGMTEGEGLRFISPLSILMGIVGLLVTLLGATLFPLT